MFEHPRTGAGVIALRNEKILLIKRGKAPYKGHWSLPGGSQEIGETLEDCARREFKEETNLDAGTLTFATIRDRIAYHDDGSLSHHFVLAAYVAKKVSGSAIALDDADDIGWYTVDEMAKIETTPDTPDFIAEVLSQFS